jgi:hypothetical protein
VQSFDLRIGDTVKYITDETDVSFVFRGITPNNFQMGQATKTAYTQATYIQNVPYSLNVDADMQGDLLVRGSDLFMGRGNITFTLIDVPTRVPIIVLPPKKRVVEPVANITEQVIEDVAEVESEPVIEPVEEPVVSEGQIEFVESLSEREQPPIWGGIGIAVLVIAMGLVMYFVVTRKE